MTFEHNNVASVNITNSSIFDAYIVSDSNHEDNRLTVYTHTAMANTSPAKNTGKDYHDNEIREQVV
jgi:hypothetical protein